MDSSEREAALAAMVLRVVDTNRYMTLGTVEADGLPRLTPVYYTHDAYRTFYWASSPDSRHSGNIAGQPAIRMVIFDSTTLPGNSDAAYLGATAHEVPASRLADECAVAFRSTPGGARPFAPEELTGELRLYRADVTEYGVHIRGSHPDFGTGIDKRAGVAAEAVARAAQRAHRPGA
jgi:hypothetical protein